MGSMAIAALLGFFFFFFFLQILHCLYATNLESGGI
jgi:hypothetical protein